MSVIKYWFMKIIDIYRCIKTDDLKINKIVKENKEVSESEKREFVNLVKAMSMEEWEMIIDIVPVELCVGRIQKEIDKANQMRDALKSMTSLIK